MNVAPGATFEASTDEFAHSATVGVRIRDGQGADFLARTVVGVTEDVTVGTSAVFRRAFVAPTVAGQYLIVWDDGTNVATEELLVSYSTADTPAPTGFDLCTLDDVKSYVPAYTGSSDDAILQRLITAESDLIPTETGREIIGREASQPAARRFLITATSAQLRTVPVDDLDGTQTIVVKLVNTDGTDGATIDTDAVVPLYDGQLSPTRTWEPVTALSFPYGRPQAPALFGPDLIIAWQIKVTATWGFPNVPSFIREACAARVVLRYLSDVAAAGTDFANAANVDNLNLAGLAQTFDDALQALGAGVVIA